MKKKKILVSILIQAAVFLLLLLSFSLGWCRDNFGNISMDEIIFTLNMPLKGTANKYFFTYFMFAFLPAAVLFAIELFFCFFPKNKSAANGGRSAVFISIIIAVLWGIMFGFLKKTLISVRT